MVKGVRSGIIMRVGMTICVDKQLKVGGHFWPILECGECFVSNYGCFCPEKCSKNGLFCHLYYKG